MDEELAAARERMAPKEVRQAAVSREAWIRQRQEGVPVVSKPAEPRDLQQRRHIDVESVFNHPDMSPERWEKSERDGGLTSREKQSLFRRLSNMLADSQGRTRSLTAIADDKRTGIYDFADDKRLVMNINDTRSLKSFAEAVGSLNSEMYQRHVITHTGAHPEVHQKTVDSWGRALRELEGSRPGARMNTDETQIAEQAFQAGYVGMLEAEEIKEDERRRRER